MLAAEPALAESAQAHKQVDAYPRAAYLRHSLPLAFEGLNVAFRAASVPEPTTITLLVFGLAGLALLRRRR